MNRSTLYEMTDQYMMLMEMAEDEDTDPEVFANTLESLNADIDDKADGYARVHKGLQADISAIDNEIKRLTQRKESMKNKDDRLLKALQDAMTAIKKPKIKTPLFTVYIQKNPASVKEDDDSLIPEEYWIKHEPTINRTAIKDAINHGKEVPGAHLEQTESLRIR